MSYTTVTTDAVTGKVTVREWTAEEIAAREARLAAMRKVPASITRRQCALQLLKSGTISKQEALAMTKSAEVPAAIAAIFAQMPGDQGILAEIDFAAANYYRSNELLGMMGMTPAQIDAFFVAAEKL